MVDLRSRAVAFLSGPYILGEESHLINRYVHGELRDDPKALALLSRCLETAQTEVAKHEGAISGPGRDALYCYRMMAELLQDIKAELQAVIK